MTNPPFHRFNIWSLADNYAGRGDEPNSCKTGGEPAPTQSKRAHDFVPIHDEHGRSTAAADLAVLESLYDYGPSIAVELASKCTAADGRSIAAKTKKISTDAVHFAYEGDSAGNSSKRCDDLTLGMRMHFDLHELGTFKGALAAKNREGFEIALDDESRQGMSSKLAAYASARGISFDETAVPAREQITRIEPNNKKCTFTDEAGMMRKGRIVNISRVDALITTSTLPAISSVLVFSGPNLHMAKVTRIFEIGFAVKFCPPIPQDEFSPAVKLINE